MHELQDTQRRFDPIWAQTTERQLRVVCALVAHRASDIPAAEVFIAQGDEPSMAAWTAIRCLADELGEAYGVRVTTTRLAHGAIVRVTSGPQPDGSAAQRPWAPGVGPWPRLRECLRRIALAGTGTRRIE